MQMLAMKLSSMFSSKSKSRSGSQLGWHVSVKSSYSLIATIWNVYLKVLKYSSGVSIGDMLS